jgi:tripartite-type tricarboxylate transporter receptor subunit TctC
MNNVLRACFLLCLVCGTGLPASADFPEREITVYVGSSAGGVTDTCLRILGDSVSKSLGQPVVIVNKPGASHTICANLVANSRPDGYSLGAVSSGAFIQVPHMRKVPYDPKHDFTWIVTHTEYTSGLVVKADAPWKNLSEFLEYAKKNPGKVIYGSDGHGMGTHVLMEYLALKHGGITWKHVPIPGGPKLATALLGGHINAYAAAGTHVQFVKDGTMRLLVSFNRVRMKAAPDVPTIYELGLTDLQLGTPLVIFGPAKMPAPIFHKIEGAFLKAMKEQVYLDYLDKVQFPHIFGDGKETERMMDLKSKGWGELIRLTGIKEQER